MAGFVYPPTEGNIVFFSSSFNKATDFTARRRFSRGWREGGFLSVRGANLSSLFSLCRHSCPTEDYKEGQEQLPADCSVFILTYCRVLKIMRKHWIWALPGCGFSTLHFTGRCGTFIWQQRAWRGLRFTEIPRSRQRWILACPSVLFCLFQPVYRSCVSFRNKLSVRDFYPLVVSLEKFLLFRGKEGGKTYKCPIIPVQLCMRQWPSWKVFFYSSEIHILFTRWTWAKGECLSRRARHRPSSLKQQGMSQRLFGNKVVVDEEEEEEECDCGSTQQPSIMRGWSVIYIFFWLFSGNSDI